MTFPVTQGSVATNGSASSTATVNLPSGIVSGELLLLWHIQDYSVTSMSTPSGWTSRHQSTPTSSLRMALFYRVADGSEGSTVTFSQANLAYNSFVVRVSGHDSSANAPQVATAQNSFGSIDPPNLTPTGGAKDYKWYAMGTRDASTAAYSPPTNFTEICDTNQASTPSLSVAERDTNASSQNPGTFTNSGTSVWGAMTVAVHPGTEGNNSSTPITGSDDPTVSLTEASAVQAGVAVSDNPTVSLTETVTGIASTSSRSDNPTITLGESVSISGTATASDNPTLTLGTEASAVQAQFPASDSPTVSLTETALVSVPLALSDAPTLSLSESAAIASSSSRSDNPTVSLGSETAAIMAALDRADNPSVSLGEASAVQAGNSRSDDCAVSLGESAAVVVTVAANDIVSVSLGESAAVDTGAAAGPQDDGPRFMHDNVGTLTKK